MQIDPNFHETFDISYRTNVFGQTSCRSRALEDGTAELVCWLEVQDFAALAIRWYRRKSRLVRSREGRLVSLEIRDSLGGHWVLEGPILAGIEAIFDPYMVGHISDLVHRRSSLFHGDGPIAVEMLEAESGARHAIRFSREGTGWRSSTNERLTINHQGLRHVETAAPGISMTRSIDAMPEWDIASASPARHEYLKGLEVTEIEKGDGILEATFVRSLGRSTAAAAFVGDIGPYDRNGRSAVADLGTGELLDHLALVGIASLRFERGPPSSPGSQVSALVETARAAWHRLRDLAGAGLPLVLIGQGIGALVALQLAPEFSDAAAVVLIAAPGQSLQEMLENEAALLLRNAVMPGVREADLRQGMGAFSRMLSSQGAAEAEHAGLDQRGAQLLREIGALDPCSLVLQAGKPILVVRGANDRTTSFEDARLLMSAAKVAQVPSALLVLQGVTQGLQADPDDDSGLYAFDPKRTIPDAVLKRLASAIENIIGVK